MKESKASQTPQAGRPKLKMVTLDNQNLSNKNININISYNLTEPKNNHIPTQQEPEYRDSSCEQHTVVHSSNQRMECQGKKINRNDILITENINRLRQMQSKQNRMPVLNVTQQDTPQMVSNECEISIRVINKQRKTPKSVRLSSKSKKQGDIINIVTKVETKMNARESSACGNFSSPSSPNKRHGTIRKGSDKNKPKERKYTEKMVDFNKTQCYTRTQQPQETKIKTPCSRELSGRQVNHSNKHKTPTDSASRSPIASPHPIYKFATFNRNDLVKPSPKSSLSSSKKRSAVDTGVQNQVIQKSILRHIVKVSQLSYAYISQSEELQDIHGNPHPNEGHELKRQQERVHYAADTIKLYWREYRRNQVLCFYESVFRKNIKKVQVNQPYALGSFDSIENINESQAVESVRLGSSDIRESSNSEKEADPVQSYELRLSKLQLLRHRQSSSGNIEQEDSQFNINKYHQLNEPDAIDQSNERPIVSRRINPKQTSQLMQFKKHQIQQWNGLKHLISHKLQEGKHVDSAELLQHLIEQTQQNKKWIESSCSQRQPLRKQIIKSITYKPDSGEDSLNSSLHSDVASNSHKQLAEQKGIAEKIFKDSIQINRRVLENEQNLIISRRCNHKSSLSENSMGSNHKQDSSCEQIDNTFKEERNSLSQLLESQSLQQQSVDNEQNAKASDSINSYLDCGLNQFDFKERTSEVDGHCQNDNVEDDMMDNKMMDRLEIHSPERESFFKQLEETQPPLHNRSQHHHQDRQVSLFDWLYEEILEEFCMEIHQQPKIQLNLKRSFLNAPVTRSSDVRHFNRLSGIRCGHQSVREYLTGFIHFILRNPQYSQEVIKNINYVLGPSSREILFYLRVDSEDGSIEFMQQEGYLFAIPLNIFESYQLSLPLNASQQSSIQVAMMNHHWHRAIFESLNQTLDGERPYGVNGKPYLWSDSTRVSTKKITRENLPLSFRSSINKLLQMISLPCGIMFDQPDCPYYSSMLLPQEKAKLNEDRISLMLADELFENEVALINYDDQITEVLLEITQHVIDRILCDTSIELRKLRRVRSFMQ